MTNDATDSQIKKKIDKWFAQNKEAVPKSSVQLCLTLCALCLKYVKSFNTEATEFLKNE